ncbi:MAG: ATP-binding protein [Neobacillus sp.]
MQIARLLSQMENQWFVGREQELSILEEIILHKPEWYLIHITGPTGIGKTSLLKRFQTIHPNIAMIYFSGVGGYETKEAFLADLWEEIQNHTKKVPEGFILNEKNAANLLNNLVKENGKIVFLFDSFELWCPIHKWIREKWIPLLSMKIRIITSSRFQLPSDWQRLPGWHGLIKTIEVGSLKKHSVQQYLDERLITDNNARYHIEYYSKGVPLALRLICDLVEQNKGIFNDQDDSFSYYLYSISQQLLSASGEIILHQNLLTTASIFWWFDYDLLKSVYDQPTTTTEFYHFCQLPYIEVCENGRWRINDDIRQWLSTDFSVRNPEKYELVLKRATATLKKQLDLVAAEQKLPYILNILHVNQNGFIKRFGFGASNTKFQAGPLTESELPIICNMFEKFVRSLKPFLPDKWQQYRYFHEVWKLQPEAFIAVRLADKIVGFITFVQLNRKTRDLFSRNPVYAEYINRTTFQEKEFLIWVISADPNYDPDVTAFNFRYIFSQLAKDTLINVVSPFPDLANIFLSLGFKSLEYNTTFTNDLPMSLLQLDLRNSDLSKAINQVLDSKPEEPEIYMQEFISLMKKILIYFHQSMSEQLIHSAINKYTFLSHLTTPIDFRKRLLTILNEMERGSEDEQLYASIIDLAYIKKNYKHDTIAERLNLSLSTYYRYLKKSIEKVAYALLTH